MDIKRRREEMGLSQEALGRLCGISKSHIACIERGERQPSRQARQRISDVLAGKLCNTTPLHKKRAYKEADHIAMIPIVDEEHAEDLRRIWLQRYAPLRKMVNARCE